MSLARLPVALLSMALAALALAPTTVLAQPPSPPPGRVVSLDGHRDRFDAPGQPAELRYLLIDVTSDDWNGDGIADHEPLDPRAILVVFQGGDGGARLFPGREVGSCCFPASRAARYAMANEGFIVALAGRASDFLEHEHAPVNVNPVTSPRHYYDSHSNGLVGHTLPGQSLAEFFWQDADAIFTDLRARFPGLPLWTIGHSNGVVNSIAAAVSVPVSQDGLILAAPDMYTHARNNIHLRDLTSLTMPVLALLHRDEPCNRQVWPPNPFDRYMSAFPATANHELILFSGGEPYTGSNGCTDPGPHYFLGIEDEVVLSFTTWMQDYLPARASDLAIE